MVIVARATRDGDRGSDCQQWRWRQGLQAMVLDTRLLYDVVVNRKWKEMGCHKEKEGGSEEEGENVGG